jgi:ABC-type dipeptide/oligopeptide/nickel transport system permease subunit
MMRGVSLECGLSACRLGMDDQGRDLCSAILHGARIHARR